MAEEQVNSEELESDESIEEELEEAEPSIPRPPDEVKGTCPACPSMGAGVDGYLCRYGYPANGFFRSHTFVRGDGNAIHFQRGIRLDVKLFRSSTRGAQR